MPDPEGMQARIFHALTSSSRSAASRPSKDQREGMSAITYSSQGLLVMGTMRPPSTTWGISAMGVRPMAASEEVTTVEMSRPIEAAHMAVMIMNTSIVMNATG